VITATAEDQRILSIQSLCALLGVSRSWYYERLSQPEATPIKDLALRDVIEELVLAFPGYGYRRVTHALARNGWEVNHKRHPGGTRRVMREESLLCQLKRRFVATTDSEHGYRRYPNLLTDRALTAPNEAWVADATQSHYPRDRNIDAGAGFSHHWESGAAEFGCLGRETAGGAPSAVPGRERVMSPPTTIRVPPRPVQNTRAHAGTRFRRRLASGCSAC